MANLKLYNSVRNVPEEAKKVIAGGRLKGMFDINPMWRIKTLTEQFGPCGFGWYTEVTEQKIEEGAAGEKVAFVNIKLYVKHDGEWSRPIYGTGGSSFIAKESRGLYTSDECFKMAYTDSISVACKSLGVGADVYYSKDRTKYSSDATEGNATTKGNATDLQDNSGKEDTITEPQQRRMFAISGGNATAVKKVLLRHKYTESKEVKRSEYNAICKEIEKEVKGE